MISVIIPVYNAEPYLARCIDSVLASACVGFEIILVNDGSTDRSPEICSGYAEQDSRVRFVSQENQGVSAARNRGLGEALGEWVVFLDADDFISDDFLDMVARPEYQDKDLILFRFAVCASGAPAGSCDIEAAGDGPAARCYQGEEMLPLIEAYPPPSNKGKYIKIKYCTQLPNTQVPSFVFFANLPQYVKEPYKRFLENKIREKWNLSGTPINIFIRQK